MEKDDKKAKKQAQMMKYVRQTPAWLIMTAILAGAAVLLQAAARNIPGFGEWYATKWYPLIVGSVGRRWGILHFSVVEVGLYFLIVGVLIYIVIHIRQPLCLSVRLLCFGAALFLVYTLNCGINYYRLPFSAYLNLEVRDSSKEELIKLCSDLTDSVNLLAESGGEDIDRYSMGDAGRAAMKKLGESYLQLKGYYPMPKEVAFSYVLSIQQLSGIYSPFTVEANYNQEMEDYNIPHTICHELSHLKGFMREDEANFIGYLACIGSDSPAFRYSGYLTGWIYAGNALYRIDQKAYMELYGRLEPAVLQDLYDNSLFWSRYEGKVAEAATKWNDTYLKINDQPEGVQSYGHVVDLMLAYARSGY